MRARELNFIADYYYLFAHILHLNEQLVINYANYGISFLWIFRLEEIDDSNIRVSRTN